jgi:hypothetical protein
MQFRQPIYFIVSAILLTTFTGELSAQQRKRSAAGPLGRWMGQTGQDYAGRATTLGPNEIQDIHIAVAGLPPSGKIRQVILRGHGGGEWQWAPDGKPPGGWAMAMLPNASGQAGRVDLFFDTDAAEKGREWELQFQFENAPATSFYFQGGKSDPNLRVASAQISAEWAGPLVGDSADLTGRSVSVGPDGFVDCKIRIDQISKNQPVRSVEMQAANGKWKWCAGPNQQGAWNAELLRESNETPSADFVFSTPAKADGTIAGQSLKLTLTYENGSKSEKTITAGTYQADQKIKSLPLPKIVSTSAKASWKGHLRQTGAGGGQVRIELDGLQPRSRIQAAVLTEPGGSTWLASAEGNSIAIPEALPAKFDRPSAQRGVFDFQPTRNLENVPLSLRLLLMDGSSELIALTGGKMEIDRRSPVAAGSKVVAKPGDNLAGLIARGGTVQLSAGTYKINKPILIDKPVQVEGTPGTVLVFSNPDQSPWPAAIKIRSGGVKLSGFAIRFEGPTNWANNVDYGPAIIGTTDNLDSGFDHNQPLWGVTISRLEITGPEPPKSADGNPPEALKIMRALNVRNGKIEGSILRGGCVHLAGGPWQIMQNRHDGPLAGSFCYDAFAVTRPVDVEVISNRVQPMRSAGKLWRFLNLTQHGESIRVVNNMVANTGPVDGDSIGDMNANEILLTESYRLKFEGLPAAISSDGRVVQCGPGLAQPPQAGDVLAILSGTQAGTFHRVVQPMGNHAVAIEPPLPAGSALPAISLSRGFTNTVIESNQIDSSRSGKSFPLVLGGNHYGTIVSKNTLTGGLESIRINSVPTESPGPWGWSHTPAFQILIIENKISGSVKPARIGGDQGPIARASQGRIYYSATVEKNQIDPSKEGPALQVGEADLYDPEANVVKLSGNKSSDAANSAKVRVIGGRVNGKTYQNQEIILK